jgi:hypothetical protein
VAQVQAQLVLLLLLVQAQLIQLVLLLPLLVQAQLIQLVLLLPLLVQAQLIQLVLLLPLLLLQANSLPQAVGWFQPVLVLHQINCTNIIIQHRDIRLQNLFSSK